MFRRTGAAAFAVLSLAAAALFATPASAVIFKATYSGTINSTGGDTTILDDQIGRAFSIDYIYDTELGFYQNAGGEQNFFGDETAPTPISSPITRVIFRAGDFAMSFRPFSSMIDYFDTSFADVGASTCGPTFSNCSSILLGFAPGNPLGDIREAFASTGVGSGQFFFNNGDQTTVANLDVTSFSVAEFTGVPEPQTWAMLIAGFCVVGIAVRRRRVSAAMAA